MLEVLVSFALKLTVKRETGIFQDNLYCPRNGKRTYLGTRSFNDHWRRLGRSTGVVRQSGYRLPNIVRCLRECWWRGLIVCPRGNGPVVGVPGRVSSDG